MTSETDKCGISSLLPISCRERAEAFAKHLNSRLQSLGSQDGILISNNGSWLKDDNNPIATSQPKSADSDTYYEFGLFQSPPDSPIEKKENELTNLLKDKKCLKRYSNDDGICLNNVSISNSLDSDSSDGPYYEAETNEEVLFVNTDDVTLLEISLEKTEINDSLSNEVPQNNEKDTLQLPNIILYDDEGTPRVRRCSSLKTGKTPPGTPGRKKIVRFADVLGLDLADVRTFLDEIPKIPNSAYNDLSCNSDTSSNNQNTKILLPLFQQPGGQANFLDIIKEKNVCLENVMVEDPVSFAIKGTVRVRNLDFHKTVHIRYSIDSWKNCSDLQATYVQNSCDGFSDKFSFLLYANTLNVGERLEFAIRYQAKGNQYWDNNFGVNYCFQCIPVTYNNTKSLSYQENNNMDENMGAAFY